MNLDEHNFNKAQEEALKAGAGPVLIIAGAGTGKTKTLTARVARLIADGCDPGRICAITFTNKAAREMRERIEKLTSRIPENPYSNQKNNPFIGTFHALGLLIIRENLESFNLPRHFSILDRSESKKMVREAIKRAGHSTDDFDIGKTLGVISRYKGSGVMLQSFSKNTKNSQDALTVALPVIWQEYENLLSEERSLDFDDLLLRPVTLLNSQPEVLKKYQDRWQWLHIDEYQDTNRVQHEMIRLLAEEHQNIYAIGDPDQTIYSWRGAEIENILRFEKEYSKAQVFYLKENYRSSEIILSAANQIIEKNKKRKKKDLFTQKSGGSKIKVRTFWSETGEAQGIAEEVKRLLHSGVDPKEIVVMYRANFQSRVLEEVFLGEEIPYCTSGVRFLERQEIKDLVAFLRVSLSPESRGDLKRVINKPPRGIGKVGFLKILEGREEELPKKTLEQYQNFKKVCQKVADLAKNSVSKAVTCIIKDGGFEKYFQEYGEDERLENIYELVTLARRYDGTEGGVDQFLEHIALFSEQDSFNEDTVGVRLSTVHGVKGLEFDHCFITGLEQGLFPHTDENTTPNKEEEERRLFYVALTRARVSAHLSLARERVIFGSTQSNLPSEFLGDMNIDLLDQNNSAESTRSDNKPLINIEF